MQRIRARIHEGMMVAVALSAFLAILPGAGCGGQAQNSSGNQGAQSEGQAAQTSVPAGPDDPALSGAAASPGASAQAEAGAGAEPQSASSEKLPTLPPVSQRAALPELTMRDMNGRDITREDLQGEVVLLNFWATWCGPCRMEIPLLVKLHEDYAGRGLRIIAPSIDQAGLAVVKPFLDRYPQIKYAVVPNGIPASQAFGGIRSIPTSFLIDRRGRVITRFVGLMRPEDLEGYVKAALREG
jgi:thiol-disulfide isomerase/thioredoxin